MAEEHTYKPTSLTQERRDTPLEDDNLDLILGFNPIHACVPR